jgi:hypothetical protein
MTAAYDNLPDVVKIRVEPLTAIWDDSALQHWAVGDCTEGRSFWRTMISGENPRAAIVPVP